MINLENIKVYPSSMTFTAEFNLESADLEYQVLFGQTKGYVIVDGDFYQKTSRCGTQLFLLSGPLDAYIEGTDRKIYLTESQVNADKVTMSIEDHMDKYVPDSDGLATDLAYANWISK